jgi:hypothetical protein
MPIALFAIQREMRRETNAEAPDGAVHEEHALAAREAEDPERAQDAHHDRHHGQDRDVRQDEEEDTLDHGPSP